MLKFLFHLGIPIMVVGIFVLKANYLIAGMATTFGGIFLSVVALILLINKALA